MLPPAKLRFIHVAMHRVDFRKGHDGLLGECYNMGLDPFAGDVVLFVSRCRRRMKLIFADDSGLWVAFKRFNASTMKTKFRLLSWLLRLLRSTIRYWNITTMLLKESRGYSNGQRYHLSRFG